MIKSIIVFFTTFLFQQTLFADVVKPTLAEATIFSEEKKIDLEFNLNIEALMSGIGTEYKDTTESPNSDTYEIYRKMDPESLKKEFYNFEEKFLKSFELFINGNKVSLVNKNIDIDIVGYTKRSRKSVLTYTANIPSWPESISWKYSDSYNEGAFRFRKFIQDEYTWESWYWLKNGESTGDIDLKNPKPKTAFEIGMDFIPIGFDHVIPLGWDHILFIVGMALSTILWKQLLILVSLFTLAHTVTLGLSMYGIVSIPSSIIEPLIALSISFIAFENLIKQKKQFLSWGIVFIFGLIHGMGFATMLKDFDMTEDSLLSTLIGFNVGVELAQVLIVIIVLGIATSLNKFNINHVKYFTIPISIIIGITGLTWALERII